MHVGIRFSLVISRQTTVLLIDPAKFTLAAEMNSDDFETVYSVPAQSKSVSRVGKDPGPNL